MNERFGDVASDEKLGGVFAGFFAAAEIKEKAKDGFD